MGPSSQIIRNGSPYEKDDEKQQKIMEDLLLFIAKAYMPIFIIENQWLRCLVMYQNPQIVFLNHKQMVQHAIPLLVAKTMEQYVIPTLDSCVTTTSFDLWMSKFGHVTFVFLINFINSLWVPCHVKIRFF